MFSVFKELKKVNEITARHYHVIFYAENEYSFQYFETLFEDLLKHPGIRICYISSEEGDKHLSDPRVDGFCIRHSLAGLFPRLRADVMVMTMPDLQNFIFKRSVSVGKYIYVFHALVSTHQQYRLHAFDHYDAVFCPGPFHTREIRRAEEVYALKPKELIDFGYPLLEQWRSKELSPGKILIAPSWYAAGILNTCIFELLEALASAERQLWLRPHPEFVKRNAKTFKKITQLAGRFNVHIDTAPSVLTHLKDASLLVTDRSGIAFEYAFSKQRPVLFIDTPPKVENREMERLGLEPVEDRYRSSIGLAIRPADIANVNAVISQLENSLDDFAGSIQQAENEMVFPPGSENKGVGYVLDQLTG